MPLVHTPSAMDLFLILGRDRAVFGSTITLVLIFSTVSASVIGPQQLETTAMRPFLPDGDSPYQLCRFSTHFSVCLQHPFTYYNDTDWCKLRMCGPSYVEAEECPADTKNKADTLCSSTVESGRALECKDGMEPSEHYLPFGCSGNNCTEHTFVCPCHYVDVTHTVLKKELDFQASHC